MADAQTTKDIPEITATGAVFDGVLSLCLIGALVWMSNGAIHYDLGRLPPDAEARIACCANGPTEDGRCARNMSEVAR